ncbi:MAG: hypothetical protein LWW95_05050 [Candidatus Desulfofervidus auxilii]|nr:hypothetical protein [Candidatus Desulfofervidus auxilii]
MASPYASIDLGTHTTRLLIVSFENNKLRPLFRKRSITKLGFYFDGNNITETGINFLIKTLKNFTKIMQLHKVKGYQAIATAILRQADNSQKIIETIQKKTGLEIKVVNGEIEAILTAKGVFSTLEVEKTKSLIVDVGGGSTEFIWPAKKIALSLPIGATWLTCQFLKHDPPSLEEINRAFKLTEEKIYNLNIPSPEILVGTAGTISTLAAIDLKMDVYQPRLINGHILSKNRVLEIFNNLKKLPAKKRCLIPGLESGREEVILGGSIIVLALFNIFQKDTLIVSEGGLLEGILIDYLEKISKKKNLKIIL